MRICLQRVRAAAVEVDQKVIAQINRGLVLLVGICHGDSPEDAAYLADKCVNLRIFADAQGKMNLSALEKTAEIMAISQFTLCANTQRGRRPSFTEAAPAELSLPLFEQFVAFLKASDLRVETGLFGANMQIDLVNDGPVTLVLESRKSA